MPLINEDGTIDKKSKGDWHRCDVCNKVERLYDFDLDDFTEAGIKEWNFRQEVALIFKQVRKGDIPECLCGECIDKARPGLYKLRDVIELDIFLTKLGKAINEKRKQGIENDWTTEDDACKCCERCPKRRLGHRACHGAA